MKYVVVAVALLVTLTTAVGGQIETITTFEVVGSVFSVTETTTITRSATGSTTVVAVFLQVAVELEEDQSVEVLRFRCAALADECRSLMGGETVRLVAESRTAGCPPVGEIPQLIELNAE